MKENIDRRLDSYECSFLDSQEEELIAEVKLMEANSTWVPGIKSNTLILSSVDAPIFAAETAAQYGLDEAVTLDTAQDENTRLVVHQTFNSCIMDTACVRDTAWGTLCETAKLSGSALGRMSSDRLADTLNNGIAVARGFTLMLVRWDKAAAFHSDGNGGYAIMPISELLETSKREVSAKLGEMRFKKGYNSHGYTQALWELPESQGQLMASYQQVLAQARTGNVAANFMPAVLFESSDTASTSARLTPIFITGSGALVRLVSGVEVRHEKRTDGALYGVELFEQKSREIWAMFNDAVQKAGELAQITVDYPENCVVSLCKRYAIPKKYGDSARESVAHMAVNGAVSAHDVYIAMSEIVGEAQIAGASGKTINFLTEAVAKVLNADWSEHDVGGVVAW